MHPQPHLAVQARTKIVRNRHEWGIPFAPHSLRQPCVHIRFHTPTFASIPQHLNGDQWVTFLSISLLHSGFGPPFAQWKSDEKSRTLRKAGRSGTKWAKRKGTSQPRPPTQQPNRFRPERRPRRACAHDTGAWNALRSIQQAERTSTKHRHGCQHPTKHRDGEKYDQCRCRASRRRFQTG